MMLDTVPFSITRKRVDTGMLTSDGDRLAVACTVYIPSGKSLPGRSVAIFGLPGGGYSRGYFDMRVSPDDLSFSQAAYHCANGFIFVALDHIGVGESSTPPETPPFTAQLGARTMDVVVRAIQADLRSGLLDPSLSAMPGLVSVGIGQSMGGFMTIHMQSEYQTYDGIAVLGYSAVHTQVPQPDGTFRGATCADDVEAGVRSVEDWIFPFHWDGSEENPLTARDIAAGLPNRKGDVAWGSRGMPAYAGTTLVPDAVAAEAAAIKVPVLIAAGEREVYADPYREPAAYSNSDDIWLTVVPKMAHMHNFAATRMQLWDRIEQFSRMVEDDINQIGATVAEI